MKPIFRCGYCDQTGIKEEIEKHEQECIYNYTKKSCLTCKHAENKIVRVTCKRNVEIPDGKMYENCGLYEWDEKHTTGVTNIFGSLFGVH